MKIRALDDALLRVCTKVSHALQRATGLTNYFIAKLGLAFTGVAIVIDILNYLHKFLSKDTPMALMVLDVIILLEIYLRTWLLTKAEEQLWIDSTTKPRMLLFDVKRPPWWRITWIIGFIFVSILCAIKPPEGPYRFLEWVAGPVFPFGLVIFYYFVAVDPLPPGKNKVREWIESFRSHGELATERGQ